MDKIDIKTLYFIFIWCTIPGDWLLPSVHCS